jgi:hypothetical protein
MRPVRLAAALVLAGLAGVCAQHAFAADDVTIYRCVDAKGRLSLRDTPCGKDEKQETRTMVRPRDAAPRPAPAPPPVQAPPAAPPPPTVAYATPPRPLYECITPDDVTYTSDTGDGNPRWVPLWTLGYAQAPFVAGSRSGFNATVGTGGIDISGGRRDVVFSGYGNGATYVVDTCYELPQSEVCARTRDRRDEIRTRFFNAMPSERDVLRVEERSLNARLANDCADQ